MEEGDVARHLQVVRGVPAGAVEDEDGVLVLGQRGGEVREEDAHRLCRDVRQHEGEVLAGGGPDGGKDVRPGVAHVAEPGRALPAGEPAMAHAPLLAEAGLVLEPERQALVRMRCARGIEGGLEPPFANASRAAGSAFGWAGRAFCRDSPSRCSSLPIQEGS